MLAAGINITQQSTNDGVGDGDDRGMQRQPMRKEGGGVAMTMAEG